MSDVIKICSVHGELTLAQCNKHGRGAYRCKLCMVDVRKKYYEKHKEKVLQKINTYRKNNAEKVHGFKRAYFLKNKEKLYAQERVRRKKYDLAHPEAERLRDRRYKRKAVKELRDSYIKCKLVQDTGLSRLNIPKELIEVKRIMMIIRRRVKSIKKDKRLEELENEIR